MSQGQAAGDSFDQPTRDVMPSQGATSVHLLRHGAVENFEQRVVRGHLDVALSSAGRRQHERLVSWYAAHEGVPDAIVCSDLSRCRALGEALATATGAPLTVDPRLREQFMGDWEGHTWEQITAQHGLAVNDYWDDYVNARPAGGESLREAAARVLAVWEEDLAPRRGEQIAVVTHVGPIRILACHALGLDLTEALRFAPPAASFTSLLVAAAGCVVGPLGERPWLGHADPPLPAPVGTAPRIALSGSAGTGKTTLGRRLAAALGVPFLEEGMRERLAAGLDLHRLRHAELRRLVEELWHEQRAAEDAATGGFVADRSAADFAAFWIHYGFHHDTGLTEPWMDDTLGHLPRYDRVVLLPWGVLPLRSDGVRSDNRWIQFMFQSLVEALLERHTPEGRLLRLPALDGRDARLAWVLDRLSE